jgi:hypothetical protein
MLDIRNVRKEKMLAKLLPQRFGQAPVCRYADGHAEMPVPRDNITESGQALLWLTSVIEELEEQSDNSDFIDSLRGLYCVLRDCSLMAKYHLGMQEAKLPPDVRGHDLLYRFSVDEKDEEHILMEIGFAVPKEVLAVHEHD